LHAGFDADLAKASQHRANASSRNPSDSEIVFVKGATGYLDLFVDRLEIGKTALVRECNVPGGCESGVLTLNYFAKRRTLKATGRPMTIMWTM
jgi:hypothetical protein